MRFLHFLTALAVAIVLHSEVVQAQQKLPPAKCNTSTGFDWTFNSERQSPCDVASALAGVCVTNGLEIPAINTTQQYLGPSPSDANSCRCNTVFYSLLSACAACEGSKYLNWSEYSINCSTALKNAPVVIPFGTAVPAWVYILNVTGSDRFDPILAKQLAGGPETPGPTTIFSSSKTQSQTGLASTTTTTATATSSSHNTNTGAIAGGVVGGVAGVSIIAALAFWISCRGRKSHRPPEVLAADSPFMVNTRNLPGTPTPMRSVNDYHPSTHISPYMIVSSSAPRIYNPSDPSTFPDAQGMQPLAKTSSGHSQYARASTPQHKRDYSTDSSIPPGKTSYSAHSHRRNYSVGSYTGKPEI